MLAVTTALFSGPFEMALVAIGLSIGPLMVYAGIGIFLVTRADARWRRSVPCEIDQERPYDWLIPSAVVALVAFAPLGVAALIHAARVGPFLALGRLEEARDSARRARMWFWLSASGGVVVLLGWLFLLA